MENIEWFIGFVFEEGITKFGGGVFELILFLLFFIIELIVIYSEYW